MGWAKYYEDNISIMNNRCLFSCAERKDNLVLQNSYDYESEKKVISPKNKRAELEIHFLETVKYMDARKLQMNGWWWSKVNNCWCNYNTAINRAFAKQFHCTKNMIKTAF